MSPVWEIANSPSEVDESVITEGVFAHGRSIAVGGNAQPLACFVRDNEKLIAGGLGRTEYGRLFVTSVWVAEEFRGQGIGSEILCRMEQEAVARECCDVLIETLLDRNARLYERLGYKSITTVPNYVGPFTRHIMSKSLRSLPVS